MTRDWLLDELREFWGLNQEQFALINGKTDANKLGIAGLLKFFEIEGRFPERLKEIPAQAIDFLAKTLKVNPGIFSKYELSVDRKVFSRSAIANCSEGEHKY